MQLFKRDLPAFLKWLERVRAGADPTNDATGQRIARALEREKMVRSARAQGLGLINERQKLFDAAAASSEGSNAQWLVVRATIRDFASFYNSSGYSTSSVPNPLGEVLDNDYWPYFLLGLKRTEVPKAGKDTEYLMPFEQFDPFTKWPRAEPYRPSLSPLRENLIVWIDQATQKIRVELDAVLHPDPTQIMFDCLIEGAGRPNISPCQAMHNISQYLYTWRYSSAFPKEYASVATDTLARLQEIRLLMTQATSFNNARQISDEQKKKIVESMQKIYEISVLDFASSFFSGRLETAIRLMMFSSLTQSGGGILSQNVVAKLLASQNLIAELTLFSGNDDLTAIGRDIQKSQQVTQELIQIFGEAFSDSIDRAMHFYKKRVKQMREGLDGKNSQELAELCFKLLALPFPLKDLDLSVCRGVQLKPVFAGWPSSVTWSDAILRRRHSRRACTYRDFLRQNRIYQYEAYEK